MLSVYLRALLPPQQPASTCVWDVCAVCAVSDGLDCSLLPGCLWSFSWLPQQHPAFFTASGVCTAVSLLFDMSFSYGFWVSANCPVSSHGDACGQDAARDRLNRLLSTLNA